MPHRMNWEETNMLTLTETGLASADEHDPKRILGSTLTELAVNGSAEGNELVGASRAAPTCAGHAGQCQKLSPLVRGRSSCPRIAPSYLQCTCDLYSPCRCGDRDGWHTHR